MLKKLMVGLGMLTFSLLASAVENKQAKTAIYLEAVSYRVVTEFNVHAMQKDKVSKQSLFDTLALGDGYSNELAEVSQPLKQSWQKYRSFAWQKHSQTDGDIDTYVFNDMRILHREFLKIMKDVKQAVNADLLNPADAQQSNALLLIEQLGSEYLEISAATFGTFGFAGSQEAIQIEKRAQAFDNTLDALAKLTIDDKEKSKKVKKLTLRWKFIKGTLLAYNERSAPFAVAKTVAFIRKQIRDI